MPRPDRGHWSDMGPVSQIPMALCPPCPPCPSIPLSLASLSPVSPVSLCPVSPVPCVHVSPMSRVHVSPVSPVVPRPHVPPFPMSPYWCPPCPCVSRGPYVPSPHVHRRVLSFSLVVPPSWVMALGGGVTGVTGGHQTPSPSAVPPRSLRPRGGAMRLGAPRGSEPLCTALCPALWRPFPERTKRVAMRGGGKQRNGNGDSIPGASPRPKTALLVTALMKRGVD